MMESCRGTVPSPLHRSGYTTWFVDSAESPALTTSEDLSSTNLQCSPVRSITLLPLPVSEPSGEPTSTTFSHQQPTATRQTHRRALRHSQHSQSKKHHATTPTSNTFSQKHRSCHKGSRDVGTNHNDEGDKGEEARKESVRPPDCRSREYLEVESFYLPRSSPVISRRRRRSLSWHGREKEPSALSAQSVLVASVAAASPGSSRHGTVLSVEDPAAAPSPHHTSCLIQEDRKSRGISLSSNLSWFLSAGLHLPFRGQQGLAEDCRGRGLSGSDVPPRPVTQQPNSTDRGSSHIPECTADIFKTCCDLEKENAHFVVVDMVLEVLEGVKWTLSLDQLTSTNTDTHTRCRTGTHTHRRSPEGKRRPEADTHTCKHTQCCSGSDSKHTHDHEDGSENNVIHTDVPRPHRNTHRSAAEIKTHEEEEKPGGVSSEHHAKIASILSTDSGFEDCGVEDTLIQRAFLTKSLRCPMMHGDVERLAQQLVLVFRRSWLPSQKPRCGRHSLRSSLQELPGTAGVVVSSGSLTEEIRLRTRMRGTLSWAPPRFQIIFTVQPTHRRSEAVALQHFLCAGCGTELEPRYIKKLRYCEYLGKYFCDCCHSGSESVIPGRVLAHWDFSRYPVSDFSRRLLDSVWHQPLFDLTSVGKALYGRVRELEKFRELQEQLLGVKRLLTACRLSDRVMKEFEQLPAHLTQQPHLFSLDDFLRLKKGQLVPLARAVLLAATEHVDGCELCLARGFICEFCRERDILFPFQRDRCKRCPVCKACFHKTCFVSRNCPKCARIRTRRRALDGAKS